MRLVLFVICALLLLTAAPGFSVRGGGGSGGCQDCYTYADPSTGISWAYCAPPEDGGWGMTGCKVDCVKYGNDLGACGCSTSGDGCMYIVVQG
ncbi:MAG TPA: hypothetical protein VJZ76_10885 [Thermoanaerobaculia bacterium]|nr:hypothetical protein [Thermoanaerobaculia bacterium]